MVAFFWGFLVIFLTDLAPCILYDADIDNALLASCMCFTPTMHPNFFGAIRRCATMEVWYQIGRRFAWGNEGDGLIYVESNHSCLHHVAPVDVKVTCHRLSFSLCCWRSRGWRRGFRASEVQSNNIHVFVINEPMNRKRLKELNQTFLFRHTICSLDCSTFWK
jgi:hypothetical protein